MAHTARRFRFPFFFLAALATAGTAATSGAEEPVLRVRLEGATFSYPIGEIARIVFAGDTLFVETSTASDSYLLGTVEKIDFTSIATAVENPAVASALPRILSLFPNRPNPFSPETKISFYLAAPGRVQVRIYGVDGRRVRSLADGEAAAGVHEIAWDGRDDAGRRAGAGVYFCKLSAPGVEESRRMILLP